MCPSLTNKTVLPLTQYFESESNRLFNCFMYYFVNIIQNIKELESKSLKLVTYLEPIVSIVTFDGEHMVIYWEEISMRRH